MDVQLEDLLHDFPDDILKSGDKPWTVHDGQMFASHVWSQKARAPNERRLQSSEQLSAWVDSCTDFVDGVTSESPSLIENRTSVDDSDFYLSSSSMPKEPQRSQAWSVHDGKFFAEHVREKRPRAPLERKIHRAGGGLIVDPKRWRGDADTSGAPVRPVQLPLPTPTPQQHEHAAAAQQAALQQAAVQQAHQVAAAERARVQAADLAQQQASRQRQAQAAAAQAVSGPGGGLAQGQQARRRVVAAGQGPPGSAVLPGGGGGVSQNGAAAGAVQAVQAAGGVQPRAFAPSLLNDGALHRSLLDFLPMPMFVRSATGAILYANRALTDAAGVPAGSVPAPWQVAPQIPGSTSTSTPSPTATGGADGGGGGASTGVVPETDLPPDAPASASAGSVPSTPLPQPMFNYTVRLADPNNRTSLLQSMHRIPFWLATEDGSNMQRAVCLYVQVMQPASMMFFPAVSKSRPATTNQPPQAPQPPPLAQPPVPLVQPGSIPQPPGVGQPGQQPAMAMAMPMPPTSMNMAMPPTSGALPLSAQSSINSLS
jgi:PAS domain-containing protein